MSWCVHVLGSVGAVSRFPRTLSRRSQRAPCRMTGVTSHSHVRYKEICLLGGGYMYMSPFVPNRYRALSKSFSDTHSAGAALLVVSVFVTVSGRRDFMSLLQSYISCRLLWNRTTGGPGAAALSMK